MKRMGNDGYNRAIQCFRPYKFEAVAVNGTFTPGADDLAIMFGSDTGVQIDGVGEIFPVLQGSTFAVLSNRTYKLIDGSTLAVM